MREFAIWLFSDDKPFNIDVFNFWHILYATVIIGTTILLGTVLSKKSEKVQDRVLSIIASATAFLYLSDFFIQPLMHGDASVAGEMNIDKLPFHICTLLCPVLNFVQHSRCCGKLIKAIKEPVAILAIVGPLMYICYPSGAVGDISPICYKMLQTFIYHGLVFSWGFNMIATKRVIPSIKRFWKTVVGLGCVALWASLGNALYISPEEHFDWFFLTGSSFPFIPEKLMPIVVIGAISGVALLVYAIYYAVMAVKKKNAAKKAA